MPRITVRVSEETYRRARVRAVELDTSVSADPAQVTFLDTNILLYAISTNPAERRKANIAIALLNAPVGEVALSVQVLQEFYAQATRPSRGGALSHRPAEDYVELWQGFRVQDNTVALFRAAIGAAQRFGISYWDAAIVEAARMTGCDTVLSEDLRDVPPNLNTNRAPRTQKRERQFLVERQFAGVRRFSVSNQFSVT